MGIDRCVNVRGLGLRAKEMKEQEGGAECRRQVSEASHAGGTSSVPSDVIGAAEFWRRGSKRDCLERLGITLE